MSEDRQHPDVSDSRRGDATPNETSDEQPKNQLNVTASHSKLHSPGARVGRYRLLAPLACGGMAQVWAAKPEGAGFARTIALKLIRQDYAADEEYARMFIDEATIAASIHHPNVCETYELGREESMLFMAIEWVAGDSLAGLLHRGMGLDPLPVSIAARIVADACAGLHAAHTAVGTDGLELGVVHRDVSPPNILLSLHGQVKVSDFGIAKARHQIHSRTRTGEIKGKFAYIAPEQIGGKGVDRRADLFALGCVLYVATLGVRPFGSGPKAMAKIISGEYKRPRMLADWYPADIERIIERCLRLEPNERFESAEEMRMELERWLLRCEVPVGTKDVATLVKERLDPKKRKVVETLLRSNQFLPDAMVYQMMGGEVEQTPTANSSVMFGPLSNPSLQIPAAGRLGPKPMVRFSAFGRPQTVDDGPPNEANIEKIAERTDPEDDPTSTEYSRPSLNPDTGRPSPTQNALNTVRSLNSGGIRRSTLKSIRETSPVLRLNRYILFAILVLMAIAIGWGSCHWIPR
jgi:serine/threonine-protein kinase